jgi:hypothetical protein
MFKYAIHVNLSTRYSFMPKIAAKYSTCSISRQELHGVQAANNWLQKFTTLEHVYELSGRNSIECESKFNFVLRKCINCNL